MSNGIGLRKDFKEYFFGESWAGVLTLPLGAGGAENKLPSRIFKPSARDLRALTELNMKLGYEDQCFPPVKPKRQQAGWFALDG